MFRTIHNDSRQKRIIYCAFFVISRKYTGKKQSVMGHIPANIHIMSNQVTTNDKVKIE